MEKIFLPEEIKSGRVTLRSHEKNLATEMFRAIDKDRTRLAEFLPWVDATRAVTDSAKYIESTQEKWQRFELFDYGIFLNEGAVYMGNCGVHSIAWQHNRCELGYWILGDYVGQGFISEAVGALEKVLFGFGFNRIDIHCSTANTRSANVPRRNGYTLEGIHRQDVIENGKYRDTLVFAKLREDYFR